MIDVRMRQQDLHEVEPLARDDVEHRVEIAARIDDRGGARALAPQHRAVLLERGHRNDGQLHAAHYDVSCAAC